MAIWSATILTSLEKQNTKPFNPLLGETYELVTDKMKFFAEQVSHHPPISAFHCSGNAGWKVWSNNNSKSKFNGKNLNLTSTFNIYVDLDAFNERYEITAPTVSAHNLVIGTLYLDLGGKSVIRNVNKESE